MAICDSKSVGLVCIDVPLFDAAWDLYLDRAGERWSFTDCTSFVLMESLGVRKALTFDGNFREAGFAMLP